MRKNQSTFCVNVRPWPHLDIHTWGPSFWIRRILGNRAEGPSGALVNEQGSYNAVQNMGHKGPVLRPRCVGPVGARTQIYYGTKKAVFYIDKFLTLLFLKRRFHINGNQNVYS
jgi:hypothetical protein